MTGFIIAAVAASAMIFAAVIINMFMRRFKVRPAAGRAFWGVFFCYALFALCLACTLRGGQAVAAYGERYWQVDCAADIRLFFRPEFAFGVIRLYCMLAALSVFSLLLLSISSCKSPQGECPALFFVRGMERPAGSQPSAAMCVGACSLNQRYNS